MQAPQPAVLLRIYTEEGRQSGHRPLYEEIVLKARKLGLAGATVLRGPMGFGQSSVIHTAKIMEFSGKLPLVIEIVDTDEKVRALLAAMDDMRGIGLVTLEKVEVVHYGGVAPSA
jgi:PII-like signaling protein